MLNEFGVSDSNQEASFSVVSKGNLEASWTGELDGVEVKRPGGLLLAALIRCARSKGFTMIEMASKLDVTYGYINQLRSGHRNVEQISDGFSQSCARFLEVPRLTVLMLAGRVTPKDLVSSESNAENELASALAFLSTHVEYGHLLTNELKECSFDSRFLLVKLFERATGLRLLETTVEARTLSQEIGEIRANLL